MKSIRNRVTAVVMTAAMSTTLFCGIDGVMKPNVVRGAGEGPIYTNTTLVESNAIDFSGLTEEDWSQKLEMTYAYTNDVEYTVDENFNLSAKVSIDQSEYDSLGSDGYLKFQGVVKLTDSWTYTTGDTLPYLGQSDFTENSGNYETVIEIEFKDKTPSTLMEIDFEIVGAKFVGTVSVSNVTVENKIVGDIEMTEAEDIVLSDFSSASDFADWDTEEGWDYYHGGSANSNPVISHDSVNERMQVYLDYSANSAATWSEAKVKFIPKNPVDISNYNQLELEITYPDSLDNAKMKFYSEGIVNKDFAIDETTAVDMENGYKKVKVAVSFSPSSTPITSLSIGIIGVSTDFKGNVYLDNLILTQKSETEDFVKITAEAGAGTMADISNIPESVTLTDSNANSDAIALAAYLKAVASGDKVVFGHQNDVFRSVGGSEFGDVYDMTGSVSGMFGIDTLAIFGSEAGGTDAESAFDNSVKYSLDAAGKGAIITLSAHMPNFTSSKITKNEDGTYNFFECNFAESKDLSNDSAMKILPGGEYNDVYTAYLDIIAEYAINLQEQNIPLIFRPLHEDSGSWFWWGSTVDAETYKSLYRYTKDYIESCGVHNMLWVYSPNGPIDSEENYLSRYPGDEYVDILGFDYYDDYSTYPATSDGSFYKHLSNTCKIVSGLAQKRNKISAISETGVRAMKADGSDNEGLLVKNNPVSEEATGVNWYQKINDIANENNISYYLVWANFSDTNFYVPYKYNDTYGQEMINDFINYYNNGSSVFGNGTNFYNNIDTLSSVNKTVYDNAKGYMVYPFTLAELVNSTSLSAVVNNAVDVKFVLYNPTNKKTVTLAASAGRSTLNIYTAVITDEVMKEIGKTDVGTISLVADGTVISVLNNISFGKVKDKAPDNVVEDFDYYSGSDGLLEAAYTENSAGGCSSEFVLDEKNFVDGTFGGAFNYKLSTTGSEVWTGRIKAALNANDFSKYNALQLWVKPDGKGQKLVIQLTDTTGEEFEVYLTDFVKGTDAAYVTVPLSAFKGKKGGTLNASNITKFAVWCNSVIPEGYSEEVWNVDSTIYFDAVKFVSITDEQIKTADANGLIITDKSLVENENDDTGNDEPKKDDEGSSDVATGYNGKIGYVVLMMTFMLLALATVCKTGKKKINN